MARARCEADSDLGREVKVRENERVGRRIREWGKKDVEHHETTRNSKKESANKSLINSINVIMVLQY